MEAENIDYAIRHTKVLYVPDRRIDSFGDTQFNFRLISEPMDSVGVCRIRRGRVEARRPRILRPADMRGIEMEGFSRDMERFFEFLSAQGGHVQALLRYGFQFARSSVEEELVHDGVRDVADRVVEEALNSGDSLRAVIWGVDDAWEASLLRFMLEMIEKSHEINIFDYRRRGLI